MKPQVMNRIVVFFVLLLFVSCSSKVTQEKGLIKKDKLVMYSASELALLMEEMYQYNDSIKTLIENGILPTQQFPDKFLKIHTAEMTSTFERNSIYESFAKTFVEYEKSINTSTLENVKINFNNAINTCIACHQTSCTGPIPRIEKLLIK